MHLLRTTSNDWTVIINTVICLFRRSRPDNSGTAIRYQKGFRDVTQEYPTESNQEREGKGVSQRKGQNTSFKGDKTQGVDVSLSVVSQVPPQVRTLESSGLSVVYEQRKEHNIKSKGMNRKHPGFGCLLSNNFLTLIKLKAVTNPEPQQPTKQKTKLWSTYHWWLRAE